MSKRIDIINEFINRITKAFGDTHIIERGKISITESDIPCIYIYEDVEQVAKKQWNNYICKLPLQIDIYDRSYDKPYEVGNDYFVSLASAIELDRDFNNLTIDYGMSAKYIDITLDPIVKTSVVYEFTYYEFFANNKI